MEGKEGKLKKFKNFLDYLIFLENLLHLDIKMKISRQQF